MVKYGFMTVKIASLQKARMCLWQVLAEALVNIRQDIMVYYAPVLTLSVMTARQACHLFFSPNQQDSNYERSKVL